MYERNVCVSAADLTSNSYVLVSDSNAQSISHESTTPTTPKDASRRNKKRKRLPIPPAEEESSSAPPTIAPTSASASVEAIQEPLMTPMDYAASYFQFLVSREEANPPEDESEDVCFCCKDGGEVIECDWKGLNNKFARCPKVYHEGIRTRLYLRVVYFPSFPLLTRWMVIRADCLGYDVPEGKAWYCPRHRCHLCGILADLHCRFCVTTYCEVGLCASLGTPGSIAPTNQPHDGRCTCLRMFDASALGLLISPALRMLSVRGAASTRRRPSSRESCPATSTLASSLAQPSPICVCSYGSERLWTHSLR